MACIWFSIIYISSTLCIFILVYTAAIVSNRFYGSIFLRLFDVYKYFKSEAFYTVSTLPPSKVLKKILKISNE